MIEHNIKWDNFDIIASGKTDYHCKMKEAYIVYPRDKALDEFKR